MLKRFMEIFKDEEGATMVEYGLLVALIAVFLIVAITTLRDAIAGTFEGAASEMEASSSG